LAARLHAKACKNSRAKVPKRGVCPRPDFNKLADSTRGQWSKWRDRVADHFGELRISQFDRPEKSVQ
jgi:hypothetical protein